MQDQLLVRDAIERLMEQDSDNHLLRTLKRKGFLDDILYPEIKAEQMAQRAEAQRQRELRQHDGSTRRSWTRAAKTRPSDEMTRRSSPPQQTSGTTGDQQEADDLWDFPASDDSSLAPKKTHAYREYKSVKRTEKKVLLPTEQEVADLFGGLERMAAQLRANSEREARDRELDSSSYSYLYDEGERYTTAEEAQRSLEKEDFRLAPISMETDCFVRMCYFVSPTKCMMNMSSRFV